MKASPAAFHVTSVTWRNIPSTGGSGGLGCLSGPVPSSEASCFRPKTMVTWPAGLNLTTMSEPLSAAQMLSALSTLTVYAWSFAHTVRVDKADNIWAADKGSDMVDSDRVRERPRVQVVADLA